MKPDRSQRNDYINKNVKDLSQEEIEALGDMELNCCDNCGEIEDSIKLNWIDSEEFYDDKVCVALVSSGMCALCDDCLETRGEKFAQCGSCEKYFIVTDSVQDCSHCHSGNWVYGYIDENLMRIRVYYKEDGTLTNVVIIDDEDWNLLDVGKCESTSQKEFTFYLTMENMKKFMESADVVNVEEIEKFIK